MAVTRPLRDNALYFIAATASVVVAVFVYWWSNPGVVQLIDSGELMTVLHSGGVAHPTGYPLFSLCGYVLAMLDRPNPAAVLPWISHLPAALAVGVVCWIAARQACALSRPKRLIVAALGATSFGCSRSLWLAAGEVEVYALTALLVVVALGICLEAQQWGGRGRRRFFLLWAFVMGLGAGNHLSVLAVLPAGFWLWLSLPRKQRWSALAMGFALAALGASVLLQLPLRAAADPLVNWGNPDNWERFWRHARAAQYQVWMFSRNPVELVAAAAELLRLLCLEDMPAAVLAVLVGLFGGLRRHAGVAAPLAAVIVFNLLLTLNYDIPDIRAYLIPGEAALAFLAALALSTLASRSRVWRGALVFTAATLLLSTWRSAAVAVRGDYRVVDDYARTLLAGLEPHAVLLTDRWDAYSSTLYLQQVEGLRPDVALIDKELLRRSWYYRYVQRAAPDLHAAVRHDATRFLAAVEAFEADQAYDPSRLQRHYIGVCRGLLRGGPQQRPGYALLDQPEEILQGWGAVPRALAWRVLPPGQEPIQLPALAAAIVDPPRTPPTGSATRDERAMILANDHGRFARSRGLWLAGRGDLQGAIVELERAARLLPRDPLCRSQLTQLYRALGRNAEATRSGAEAERLRSRQ